MVGPRGKRAITRPAPTAPPLQPRKVLPRTFSPFTNEKRERSDAHRVRIHINAVIGRRGKPSIGGALLLLVEGEHPDVGFFEIAVEVNGAIIWG